MDKQFSIGIIISTYNSPAWLQKVLWGYQNQTVKPDEIVIADDGSKEDTRLLIEEFAKVLPIKHIWHEDRGFQKSQILNKALAASTADYLIFTDQDCIPRPDFVETHLRFSQKGYFLSGGYFKLPMDISLSITEDDIKSERAFSLKWLHAQGLKYSFKCTKLFNYDWFASFMNHITTAKATWNGCNASGWREDLMTINGFNEDMQYGGQDREFGERLFNLGLKSKQIRYTAICLHLDHKRPYKTKESIQKNIAIRKRTRKSGIIETPNGIRKIPSSNVEFDNIYDQYAIAEKKNANLRSGSFFKRHFLALFSSAKKKSIACRYIELLEKTNISYSRQEPNDIIVSLTSFPARIHIVHLVIKSLFLQSIIPQKIILWLSADEFPNKEKDLPDKLRSLCNECFEIRFVNDNMRSHKKYMYALKEFSQCRIITVDDDTCYPNDTIQRLTELSAKHPRAVCANIVREIATENNVFLPYNKWRKTSTAGKESASLIALGYGGVLYPANCFQSFEDNIEIIKEKCLYADDLWLKANELKEGITVACDKRYFAHPITIKGSQKNSLQKTNNGSVNQNDNQWRNCCEHFSLNQIFGI